MVAGDLVNTASRIQSLAEPGTVFVGDATRRATEQTIAYEDAGSHELKGKVSLTPLWRALRVVSGARGSLKSAGLEAPFVGRDRELRQIKDIFHACADEGKAHLVSITGIAGIGKSRLGWEFYKYFDGIAQVTYWHRGRCLSYGEGVTYWALADMVRMRARIAEDEEPRSAIAKLAAVVEEHIPDAEERRFVEPRLAHLLGARRGERRLRARGPFRRLAALLRAADRRLPGRDALRGHAVGGRVAPRLHRVPARVGTQLADPRRHPGSPRAARAAADLGSRPSQLQLDLPRAALARGDGRAARRPRPGPPRRAANADPCTCRRNPALCGRDRAHAARPGRARPGGAGLPADWDDRLARGPRDPARSDRRAAGRPPG